MVNYNLLATLGGSQKNLSRTNGQKSSMRSANVSTPYLQVLQNTLFKSSASRSNSQVKTSTNYNVSYTGNFLNNSNPYVSDPRSQILMGDANNDGAVDNNDLELLQLNVIGLGNIKNFRASDMDGDGKITMTDVSKLSLMLQEQKNSVSKIKGDVNGDGKVDVINDAVTINNYVNGEIQKKDFLYNNADVNGDGTVDLVDAKKIEAYYNGEIKSLEDDWTWQATALQKLPVYTDENLTVRNGNEEVWANDKVTVLKANAKSYLIRYPAGNGYKDRWVSKTVFDKPAPPPPPEPYQAWAATATSYKEAFTDENLTTRIGNEAVFAGDKITVLDERDNSYLVRYSVKNGYKERWVSKSNIEPYTEPIIPDTLQKLIDKWNGKTWKDHTYLSNVKQCKEFASYIFYQLTGVKYPGSGSTSSNYYNWRLNGLDKNIYQVAEVSQNTYLNAANAKALFSQAQSGDFIQMKRGHGGAHSAILSRKNDEGVWFFEANADGKNTIQEKFYSWNDLVKITSKGYQYNVAMSIYRKK